MEQKEISVLGKQWVIQQLPAEKGMKVVVQIAHIIAGVSKGVGFAKIDDIGDTPINIAGVIAGVLERLDADASPAFVKRIVLDSVIMPQDKRLTADDFDFIFAGQYDALWELVAKIIELNKFDEVLKKRFKPIIQQLFSDGENPNLGNFTPS